MPQIDVMIPVYKPGEELRELLKKLMQQTIRPASILLVNTEEKYFEEKWIADVDNIEVIHISKDEFDHGATRHMAAGLRKAPYMLFMTQDAIPADEYLIETLYRAFENETVGAAYAKQLPNKNCNLLERYTRSFNYGARSRIKSAEDLPELGIKTFFCSNVCAMYRRDMYEELGGFVTHTIFNEDMIYAGKLIQNGKAVAYCADAKVFHSHNYTGIQQFHRNFDLGVSQAEHPEVFAAVASESEGIRMVKQTARYLLTIHEPLLLPELFWQSGCKFIGYRLGKAYRRLPGKLIRWCTMNPEYWKKRQMMRK